MHTIRCTKPFWEPVSDRWIGHTRIVTAARFAPGTAMYTWAFLDTRIKLYSVTVMVFFPGENRKVYLTRDDIPFGGSVPVVDGRDFIRCIKARALRLHNEVVDALFPENARAQRP